MSETLPFVRVDLQKKKAERLQYAALARDARAAVEAGAGLWSQSEIALSLTASDLERARSRDVVRGMLEQTGVVRLDGRMVGTGGRAGMLDAVRWLLSMGATELRAPRSNADPWIVKTPVESRYKGAILSILPDAEGTPYAHAIRDAVDVAPLEAAAAREGLESIDALLVKRADQRSKIEQADRPDEDMEVAIARLHQRRLLAEDAAKTGGVGWLLRGEELFADLETKDKAARRQLERERKEPTKEAAE